MLVYTDSVVAAVLLLPALSSHMELTIMISEDDDLIFLYLL